jgi:DNA polymerase III delta prime subunit
MRALISNVRASPRIARAKVAHVGHAGDMNRYAANSFLATLEEPPRDTVIFLSTASKYDVLPTILSRCIAFKFHAKLCHTSATLEKITNMYESWLNALNAGAKLNLAIVEMYKILSCVDENFDKLAEELALTKSESVKVLLAELEQKTAKVFKENLQTAPKLHKIIENFESGKYFLSINCNIVAYLERCFILTVRFFERNLNGTAKYDNGC